MTTDLIFTTDIQFRNGDFLVNVSDGQHIEHIIKAKPGHFYQWPLIGVGLDDYIHSEISLPEIRRKVRLMLESDGFIINTLTLSGSTIDNLQIDINAQKL